MMIELQATSLVLKSWRENPARTKRQIGIWRHWNEAEASNDQRLSGDEVNRMKMFLRRNAPTSYFEIFADEKTSS
jgi:hypothetical protein